MVCRLSKFPSFYGLKMSPKKFQTLNHYKKYACKNKSSEDDIDTPNVSTPHEQRRDQTDKGTSDFLTLRDATRTKNERLNNNIITGAFKEAGMVDYPNFKLAFTQTVEVIIIITFSTIVLFGVNSVLNT